MQIKIDNRNPDPSAIEKAADVLKNSGVIVYPTDTCYGIGVNAQDENAIRKLYKLKNRDDSKPTHVIVRDWEMIEAFTSPNETAMKLYEEFLPGPLTIILPKKSDLIPNTLTGGLPTVGVRIPDNPITKLLSSFFPFPYTTPSANRSGEKTPYSIQDVKNVLDISRVDLVFDAGILPRRKPSTIVDATSEKMKVLREGAIKNERIEEYLVSF